VSVILEFDWSETVYYKLMIKIIGWINLISALSTIHYNITGVAKLQKALMSNYSTLHYLYRKHPFSRLYTANYGFISNKRKDEKVIIQACV